MSHEPSDESTDDESTAATPTTEADPTAEPAAPAGPTTEGSTERGTAGGAAAVTATTPPTGDHAAATPAEAGESVQGEKPTKKPTREEELEARVAELEDNWRRAVADLQNYRKRVSRELAEVERRERMRVAAQWLAVVDNLDRALEHAQAEPASIIEGVRAVRDQALLILEGLGFPRQEDEPGTPFDPVRHEAVATAADNEVPEGAIVHVTRPGYGDSENQLRPAMVVVSTGKQ